MRYLHLFVNKLSYGASKGENQRRIYFVDGFAGQGRYEDGKEGSALISARRAAEAKGATAGILRCINVEATHKTFENLEKHTSEYVASGFTRNIHADFEDALPKILQEIEGQTALFFIDPLGVKGSHFPILEQIAERKGTTEILLRFDDQRISRIVGNSLGFRRRAKQESNAKYDRAADSLVKLLQGLATEETIQEALNSGKIDRDKLVRAFIDLVLSAGLFEFGLGYPIRNPATGGHKYFLVHLCNHPDGYTYMAHFMAQAERTAQVYAKEREETLGALQQQEIPFIADFAAKAAEDQKIKELTQSIPEILSPLRGERGLQVRDVLAALVDRHGWKFVRREWEAALKQSQDAGWIIVDGKLSIDRSPISVPSHARS
jgi:three-Cys-motif partner protein